MIDFASFIKTAGFIATGVGVSVTIAYAAFRLFAEKWLENKFAESLENFRHQKNLEIARLKVEVDAVLNGAILNQQKEFEVLPTLWSSLTSMFHKTSTVFAQLRSYPDINNYSQDSLIGFLDNYEWVDDIKNEIFESENKNSTFLKYNTLSEIRDAKLSCREFFSEVDKSGIFLNANSVRG